MRFSAPIREIEIDANTFHHASFSPTLINFFYGKNGTGKSTVAKIIGSRDESMPDVKIEVFNEAFIQENIQSYGNLPGVFTISETNAKIKKEISAKKEQQSEWEKKSKKYSARALELQEQIDVLDATYIDDVWKDTEAIRKMYPDTLTGYTRAEKKFSDLLDRINPKAHSDEECSRYYTLAYGDSDTPTYELFSVLPTNRITNSALLGQPIVSTGGSTFARLMKSWNTTDWVKRGHELYHNKTEGKCPYCQHDLPTNFEAMLADCFDNQYQEAINELNRFRSEYASTMNRLFDIISANSKNGFSTQHREEYQDKCAVFMEKARANVKLIDHKLSSPSSIVVLEDLILLISEINYLIKQINDEIIDQNAIVSEIPKARKTCTQMVWELMAFHTNLKRTIYHEDLNRLTEEMRDANNLHNEAESASKKLDEEISALNKQTVNTSDAKDHINSLLKSAGFQGFELKEKFLSHDDYELVRGKKGIAKGLSEGERNFIAFLYFYHIVMGSRSDNGRIMSRIVVIDDPVSSMDSESLFVVASLVRNMIAICYNNFDMSGENRNRDDHIKQIFCLTHNPYFFREISYNRVSENECAAFFEIKKNANNISEIHPCVRKSLEVGGDMINYSPVRNSYDALWHEFYSAGDSVSLMSVIRRILECYFLQMCGYNGGNLRRDLLDAHKMDFKSEDYRLMSAMIAFLDSGSIGVNDDLYFDAAAVDVKHLRLVFKRIFVMLHQEQHYDMMSGRVKRESHQAG